MVKRSVVASSFAATSIFTNYYCCFTINAQAFDVLAVCLLLIGLDVVEDGIRFGDFFLGLALTTGFNR